MHRSRDVALVLKRTAYGESSLVVQLATRDHGRVHVLAKGAYRTTSRFFCVLDLFDTLELEWSGPPRRELKTLHAGEVLRRRRHVAEDLARYRTGLTVLELCDLASRAEHRDRALFDLAERALDELDRPGDPNRAGVDPALVLVRFELGFLRAAGLAPALERCAACGGEAPPVFRAEDGGPYAERAAFSAGAGGRLCRACAEEARASGRRVGTLPVAVLEAARELARPRGTNGNAEPDRSARYDAARARGAAAQPEPDHPGHPGPERLERVRDFVGRFLDYHLETRPRSHRAFLAAPNRNAP